MFEESTINAAAQGSGLLGQIANAGSGQYANAAQHGVYPGAAIKSANLSANPPMMAREGSKRAPRAIVTVDKVVNGFLLTCDGEMLIAKDLEELQGLFVAQIAAMLLEDK